MGKVELEIAKTWMASRQADAGKAFGAIQGALELAEKIKGHIASGALGREAPRSVYGLMHGDAVFARQVVDALGLAGIAGRHFVDADDVLGALRVLCAIGEIVLTAL